MISDTDRQPRFSGAEYFTVFAKLTPSSRGSATSAPQARRPDLDTVADDLATGSVPPNALPGPDDGAVISTVTSFDAAAPVPNATAALKGYVVRSVFRGAALIESRDGLREVKLGAILPNIGLVTSIEQRDGGWVVVTSKGVITEARR